jgi:hypothetical protein
MKIKRERIPSLKVIPPMEPFWTRYVPPKECKGAKGFLWKIPDSPQFDDAAEERLP